MERLKVWQSFWNLVKDLKKSIIDCILAILGRSIRKGLNAIGA